MRILKDCLDRFAHHVQMITNGQIVGGTMYFSYPMVDTFQIKVETYDCDPENAKIAKIRLNGKEFESRTKACDAYCLMVSDIFKKAVLKDLES